MAQFVADVRFAHRSDVHREVEPTSCRQGTVSLESTMTFVSRTRQATRP